jgi:hypothetical protein
MPKLKVVKYPQAEREKSITSLEPGDVVQGKLPTIDYAPQIYMRTKGGLVRLTDGMFFSVWSFATLHGCVPLRAELTVSRA